MTTMEAFESHITFAIPSSGDLQAMQWPNVTVLLRGMDELDLDQLTQTGGDHLGNEWEYHRFMGDVWVGVVLTLMIVTSIFCMCACFLYHKFRLWKASGEYLGQGLHLLLVGTLSAGGSTGSAREEETEWVGQQKRCLAPGQLLQWEVV